MGRLSKNYITERVLLDKDVVLPAKNIYQDKDGYAIISIKGRPISLHRWIMGCTPHDGKIIDHKNRNKLDNRRANLRIVNATISARNIGKTKKPTSSKYRGVSLHKKSGKWIAQVREKQKTLWSGVFDSEDEAGRQCELARIKFYGEQI